MNHLDESYGNKHLFIKVLLIFASFILLETIALHFSSVLDLFGLYSMNITGIYYDNYLDVIFYNLVLVNLFTAISFYIKAKYKLSFYGKTSLLRLIFAVLIIVLAIILVVLILLLDYYNFGGLSFTASRQYQIFQYLFYVSASMINMYMLSFVLIPAGIRSIVKNRALRITMEILAACFAFSIIETFDWMDFSYILDQATLVLPVAAVMVLSRNHFLSLPLFLFINLGLGISDASTFSMKYFPWFLVIYPINIALIAFFSIKINRSKNN